MNKKISDLFSEALNVHCPLLFPPFKEIISLEDKRNYHIINGLMVIMATLEENDEKQYKELIPKICADIINNDFLKDDPDIIKKAKEDFDKAVSNIRDLPK